MSRKGPEHTAVPLLRAETINSLGGVRGVPKKVGTYFPSEENNSHGGPRGSGVGRATEGQQIFSVIGK